MKNIRTCAGVLVAVALGLLLASTRDATAGDCCRLVVTGCGKTANVCVAKSCGSDADQSARGAFNSANKCSSSSVSSTLNTCSNERCDIDLR
jgi:hypothetical protein